MKLVYVFTGFHTYKVNLSGQSKNKFIASLYLYASSVLNINTIRHKFLIVVGHTQNEGDSMQSVIERQKKLVLRSGPIYVPSQWVSVIKSAKQKGKPYSVKEMSTEDFFNLKDVSKDIGTNFNIE